jgi:catalase
MCKNAFYVAMTHAVSVVVGSMLVTSAAAFETVPPGEAEQIRATAEIMTKLQDRRAATVNEPKGILLRGVHPKSHGCVKAEFVVNKEIDEKYRVGLFSTPGKKFDAWIRYSNAAAVVADDLMAGLDGVRKNGSRGMAIKILNIEGDVLSLDEGQKNQDFLMISTPTFAFSDVRTYLRLNEVLLNPKVSPHGDIANGFFLPKTRLLEEKKPLPRANDLVWGNIWVGFNNDDLKKTLKSLKNIGEIEGKGNTVRNPLQVQYFGAAPFLFGEGKAMKVSAVPCKAIEQRDFEDRKNLTDPPKNYLREALTQSMKGPESICFNFKIQTRSEAELEAERAEKLLEEEPIEDATTLWRDELTSYEEVARITIPVPQAPDAPEAIGHCEKLAFTPFHSLAAHRPIGGINRLRHEVYESSATHRRQPLVPVMDPPGAAPSVVAPGTTPPVVAPGTVY